MSRGKFLKILFWEQEETGAKVTHVVVESDHCKGQSKRRKCVIGDGGSPGGHVDLHGHNMYINQLKHINEV